MKILITGGAGFQGVHIARAWATRGHEVAILNTPSMRAVSTYAQLLKPVGIRVVWGSVTDPEVVAKAFDGQDVVLHLAAWASVDASLLSPGESFRVNALGAYHVLEAARLAGLRLIFASSCEVYGMGGWLLSEASPLCPYSPYAAGKAAGERLAFAYARTYGLNVQIVRPCNIYGPGQRGGPTGAVIPTFYEVAMLGGNIPVRGDGEQRREFMHISDLVEGYTAILDRLGTQFAGGLVLNLGTGEQVSVIEIARFMRDHVGGVIIHTKARPGEVQSFLLDSSLAKQILGFTPQVKFETGLAQYIAAPEVVR